MQLLYFTLEILVEIYPTSPLFQASLEASVSGLDKKINLMRKSFCVLPSLKRLIVFGSILGSHCHDDDNSNNKINNHKTTY